MKLSLKWLSKGIKNVLKFEKSLEFFLIAAL